ncbi:MAG: DUF2851 family protein [Bacteroidaceae bacterium]|nr:DUF2851 family protein [Bacteroidaceae bacterium]
MEYMLHYAWQHRMFPLAQLHTEQGEPIEVVSVGRHNSDAGPDFVGAQLKIGGVMWAGNVEIHLRSSDWYRHHHDTDAAYDNVILHVVSEADCEVKTSKGLLIPQLKLEIPVYVQENYDALMKSDRYPRCRNSLVSLSRLTITSWFSALYVERLEQRTMQIAERRKQCGLSWEQTAFVTIARNFGFGKNGDAFERWALSIPMSAISKHRDDLFQIEAIFFGQAGFLNDSFQSDHPALSDYYYKLKAEYNYLSKKFNLQHIDPTQWKFMRMRPQSFPYVRMAQLAMLYYTNRLNLSRLVEASTIDDLYDLLDITLGDYWQHHYSFADIEAAQGVKSLSKTTKDLIVINSVVPLLFAYGKYKADENMCQRAISFLEQTKPERNHIIAMWNEAGIECRSASESQAILQLTTRYCDAKDCLHCRFGYEYIKHTPSYLKEGEK